MVHQMKSNNSGGQQLTGSSGGSRLVFAPVNNANNTGGNAITISQGAILLKSPTTGNAKIAPNTQQILGGNTIRIQPSSIAGGTAPKYIVKSTSAIPKGSIIRNNLFSTSSDNSAGQQSVIKISAASPAVQAAAAQANNVHVPKGSIFRFIPPGSIGNKIIAPAVNTKNRPITIAPNNQMNKQQQSCIFVPVSGSNSTATSTSSQNNSVYMIPLQYLSQLQNNNNTINTSSSNNTLSNSSQILTFTTNTSNSSNNASNTPSSNILQISEAKQIVPPPTPSPQLNNNSSTGGGRSLPPSSKTLIEANGIKARKPCNCNKSQCLKLYCDCFANGEFCNNCNCTNCFNNLSHEEDRQKAIKSCLERNPGAFKPKIGKGGKTTERRHNKGCNCKRSGCLKNYCECYEAKIPCSSICKCCGCKNVDSATLLERHKLQHMPPDPATIMQQASVPSYHHQSDSIIGSGSLPSSSSFSSTISAGSGSTLSRSASNMSNSASDRLVKNLEYTPTKFGMGRSNSTPTTSIPPPTSSYKISQEVVSASTGCILATAARCQRQKLNKKDTEEAIVKEFSNLLSNIIRGCMQQHSNNKTRGFGGNS